MGSPYPPQFTAGNVPPSPRGSSNWWRIFDGLAGAVLAALIGILGAHLLQSQSSHVGPVGGGSTATAISQVATIAPTLAPTTSVPTGWNELSQGGLPASGTSYSATLHAGQLLMLTGGQFQVGSTFCNGGSTTSHICVLIYKATSPQSVTITALIPGNNWVGISDSLTPTEALQMQEPNFWTPSNCQNGCANAYVYTFTDGQLSDQQTLSAGG